MRLLGIDYGMARIGLAFTDTSLDLILPLDAIDAKTIEDLVGFIQDIVVERHIDTVVVGLPLGIDASETAQSKHTRSFISQLNSVLDIDIVTIDESFSSVEAKTYLSGDIYNSQSSGRLDSASACVILNRFLKQTG